MKKHLLFATVVLSLSAAAGAQTYSGSTAPATATPGAATPYSAEAAPVFRYPEQNNQPRSELRVREITAPGAVTPQAPRPIMDTPDSVEQYQRCQRSANREATSIPDMQGRLAGCLSALDARRQAGQ